MARIVAVLLVIMTIAGCVSQIDKNTNVTGLTLGSLAAWQLTGKIGIRSGQGNANLGFVWIQTPHSYDISLTGPFSVPVAQLNGAVNQVSLTLPDGVKYRGSSIDQLLEMQLGYPLPVSLLQFWVRGIPDPMSSYESTSDGFLQRGWQIQLQQFGIMGPRKIVVQQADIRIRLVALEWTY